MAVKELRRVVNERAHPWAESVNQLVDLDRGITGGWTRHIGHDGSQKDPAGVAASVTSTYADAVQSAVGLHWAALHSGTSSGASVVPTPSNAVALVTDDYLAVGKGKQLRGYGAGGTNYFSLTGDNNGTLTLGGSGAGAGDLSMADLTTTSLTINHADTSAAVRTLIHSQENGAARWRMGFTAADAWAIINAAGNTAALTVDQETGNTLVAGTADVAGNFSVATNKFTVAASSGNTAVAGTLGVTGLTTTAGVSSSADVTLTGTGRRILAPFSEATTADRAMLQSSTTNGNTNVGVIPNGTATTAAIFAYNSSSPGTSAFARLRVTSSVVDLSSAVNGAVTVLPLTFTVGSNERARLTEAGLFLIGDTANANMTQGLTINQGASDDEILALKSSDVSHGATAVTEDDTFAMFQKNVAANGGLRITALDDTANIAFRIRAIATTADTTRSTAAVGAIVTDSYIRSGTGTATLGANGNLLVIRENDQAQFLVDVEGDTAFNGTSGAGAWDDEPEDVALLEAFRLTTMREGPTSFRRLFSDDIERHKETLARTGVITLNADGKHFVSLKGILGLLIDSLRQVYGRLLEARAEITELRRMLEAA